MIPSAPLERLALLIIAVACAAIIGLFLWAGWVIGGLL